MDLVSILISVYNGEEYIKDCIDSCLNQLYPNIEIVIYNDGSTDNTINILKNNYSENSKVLIIDNTLNRGKVVGFNTAYENCNGEYIRLLGADDFLTLTSIKKIMEFIKKNKNNIDCLYHEIEVVDSKLKKLGFRIYNDGFKDFNEYDVVVNRKSVPAASWFISKRLAQKIFPIPNAIPYEDIWLSFSIKHYIKKIYSMKGLFYYYRQHKNNTFRGVQNNSFSTLKFRSQRDLQFIQYILKMNPLQYDNKYLKLLYKEKKFLLELLISKSYFDLFFRKIPFLKAFKFNLLRFPLIQKIKILITGSL